jgi:hypothetical protein
MVPEDLGPWGYPGLTKSSLARTLDTLVQLGAEVDDSSDVNLSVISDAVLLQNINTLRVYIVTHIPPNPQPYFPELLNLIDRITSALTAKVAIAEKRGRPAIQNLARTLAASVASMSRAEELYSQLADRSVDVTAMAELAELEGKEIAKNRVSLDADLKAIEEIKDKTAAHHATVKASVDDAITLIKNLTELTAELESNRTAQKALFDKFEGYQVEIGNLIGAASQAGMASSFRTMKLDLERGLKYWLFAFIGAVLVVAEVGLLYIAPALSSRDWVEVITKLPLTFPFIWLGWFFAKQYGHTTRLREDYSFKYASAMAFEAHKREAKEIDADLLKRLLEISIKNFSDNPLRIFDNDHHVSPVHETLDSLLKNTNLMDQLKEAAQKVTK